MKQPQFLLTFFLTVAIILIFVSACNSERHFTNSGKTILKMATSADYAPYEFVDSNSKEVKGFDIDIAKRITDKLGYGLQISNIDFNGLIPALQSRQADFVMAGMVPTEERKQAVDFSQPYYEAKNVLLAKKGSRLTTLEQLKGKTIGVQSGSMQEQRAKEIAGVSIKPLKQVAEIIQAIEAGRIGAAIVEDVIFKAYAENTNLEATTIPNIPGKSGLAIAFPQGSTLVKKFDQAISEMTTGGEIEAFVLKWLGDRAPSE